MLWPAQSVYAGTWDSGPAPVEVEWVELMREYSWSWAELLATPPYVRRVCWDFMVARREAEEAAQQRQTLGG